MAAKAEGRDTEALHKAAWAHYQAGRHAEAAPLFARAADVDREAWKHPYNLACAAARSGKSEWARIALTEALARDRAAVEKRAATDEDLASVRGEPWFSALLDADAAPSPAPSNEDCDETSKSRYCMNQFLAGEFVFGEPLAFDLPLAIRVSIPKPLESGAPPFVLASGVTVEALGLASANPLEPNAGEVANGPAPYFMYYDTQTDFRAPTFWWPGHEGDPVFLLLPHQREGVETFTIAMNTAKGWMATTLDTVALLGDTSTPTYGFVGVRRDHLEIFTLAWTGASPDKEPYGGQQLCRIRWEDGALRRACAAEWDDRAP
jgi:hypothetical protein